MLQRLHLHHRLLHWYAPLTLNAAETRVGIVAATLPIHPTHMWLVRVQAPCTMQPTTNATSHPTCRLAALPPPLRNRQRPPSRQPSPPPPLLHPRLNPPPRRSPPHLQRLPMCPHLSLLQSHLRPWPWCHRQLPQPATSAAVKPTATTQTQQTVPSSSSAPTASPTQRLAPQVRPLTD